MLLVRTKMALVDIVVIINVNTSYTLSAKKKKINSTIFFLAPAITDSRQYGHQIAAPRVSAITGVDCNGLLEHLLTVSKISSKVL